VSIFDHSVATVRGTPVQADTAEKRVTLTIARAFLSGDLTPEIALEAIHALWGIQDDEVLTRLALGLQHSELRVRFSVAAALLAANDVRGMPLAETALTEFPGDRAYADAACCTCTRERVRRSPVTIASASLIIFRRSKAGIGRAYPATQEAKTIAIGAPNIFIAIIVPTPTYQQSSV